MNAYDKNEKQQKSWQTKWRLQTRIKFKSAEHNII